MSHARIPTLTGLPSYAMVVAAALVAGLSVWAGIGRLSQSGSSMSPSLAGGSSVGLASADSAFAPLPGVPAGEVTGSQGAALESSYGRLPLAFEPNVGQLEPAARFLARGAGYGLFLTRRGAVLSLAGGAPRGRTARSASLTIGFVGASRHPVLMGQRALPGRVNYMVGSDRSRWRTDIPTYARVGYRGLWPGVDVSFYGSQGRLEYDVTLAPGADPRRIGLSFGGAASIDVQRDGALRLALPGGVVRQLEPRAYQVAGGERRAVSARYVISGGRVGVRLGPYDHRAEVVIDPVLTYSTYLGGSAGDSGHGIAVDLTGAAYVTGATNSTDFPAASSTTAPFQPSSGGSQDAFVSKLNPSGSALVYSTYLGGSNADYGNAIAVDLSGDAYVAGVTSSSNFPTAHPFQGSSGGNADAFVTELNPAGDGLVYSTYLGGAGTDIANAITVGLSGAAYVTGSTGSTNFPTVNPFQASFGGTTDAFVTELNPGGSALVYSTYLGGPSTDQGYGIAVNSVGNAYVTGVTGSFDFPTASSTSHPFQGTSAGGNDAFVTELNSSGTGLVYSTYLGGTGSDQASAIAVDGSGDAFVTGVTGSTNFPTASPTSSPFQSSNAGGGAFVTELNPDGSGLVYSTYLGGSGSEAGTGIALDPLGNAVVVGVTDSGDFPTAHGPIQGSNAGSDDAFVTRVNHDGSGLLYSTYLGGSNNDEALAVAVDGTGGIFVTGDTASGNFPAASSTSSPFQSSNQGLDDAFVTRFSGPPVVFTRTATGVTQSGATLNGTVSPNGDSTTSHFDVGPTPAYLFSTASESVGSNYAFHNVSEAVSGFAPGSTVHFRVVATNSSGTTFGSDQVFTTASSTTPAVTPGVTPPGAVPKAPAISGLELTPKAFRAARSGPSALTGRRHGSRVSFTMSERANVAFSVQRRSTGRRFNQHCRRETRRNRGGPRCALYRTLTGTFTVPCRAGANSFRFTGRVNGRKLRAGHYRLVAVPSANGLVGTRARAGFRITRH